jgi:hypothetical protein
MLFGYNYTQRDGTPNDWNGQVALCLHFNRNKLVHLTPTPMRSIPLLELAPKGSHWVPWRSLREARTTITFKSCRSFSYEMGKTCATYQIRAIVNVSVYCILCLRHRYMWYAYLASCFTFLIVTVQDSVLDFINVCAKRTPRIVISW